MRWPIYFILAYVALGVQLGLGAYVRYGGAGPNLVLLAAIFIALNAPREPALLGCFVMGALQDLVTVEPLGLYALAYGLVAMFVISTQEIVYREHPVTHFSIALVAGVLTGAVLFAHGWFYPPGVEYHVEGTTIGAIRVAPTTLLLSALYTAALAPVVLWVLHRTKRMFAFRPKRMAGR